MESNPIIVTLEIAKKEAKNAQTNLAKKTSKQLNNLEEINLVQATSLSWFNNHRKKIIEFIKTEKLELIDLNYQKLLSLLKGRPSRSKCIECLKIIESTVFSLTTDKDILTQESNFRYDSVDFSPLIHDPQMRAILSSRWRECEICVKHGANLASIVMMGGLIEGLLLARINLEQNKKNIFSSKFAPIDPKTGNPARLNEWTLKNYIEVAFDMKWISHSIKDLSIVLRDYRNFIHPQKELSHGIKLETEDANTLWKICTDVSKQIIKSIK